VYPPIGAGVELRFWHGATIQIAVICGRCASPPWASQPRAHAEMPAWPHHWRYPACRIAAHTAVAGPLRGPTPVPACAA